MATTTKPRIETEEPATGWADGPMLGFDLETTGVSRFFDVPVSAALVRGVVSHAPTSRLLGSGALHGWSLAGHPGCARNNGGQPERARRTRRRSVRPVGSQGRGSLAWVRCRPRRCSLVVAFGAARGDVRSPGSAAARGDVRSSLRSVAPAAMFARLGPLPPAAMFARRCVRWRAVALDAERWRDFDLDHQNRWSQVSPSRRVAHEGLHRSAQVDLGLVGDTLLPGISPAPPAGLEPATHGLGNRRSIL
jgi:hypothetical protein